MKNELTIINNSVYNMKRDGILERDVENIIDDLTRMVGELLTDVEMLESEALETKKQMDIYTSIEKNFLLSKENK